MFLYWTASVLWRIRRGNIFLKVRQPLGDQGILIV